MFSKNSFPKLFFLNIPFELLTNLAHVQRSREEHTSIISSVAIPGHIAGVDWLTSTVVLQLLRICPKSVFWKLYIIITYTCRNRYDTRLLKTHQCALQISAFKSCKTKASRSLATIYYFCFHFISTMNFWKQMYYLLFK